MKTPMTPTKEQRDMVKRMAHLGFTRQQICLIAGVVEKTLNKHFAHELAIGSTEITAKIAATLAQKALSGDNTCMIFWLRTRGGWKYGDAGSVEVEAAVEGEKKVTVRIVRESQDQEVSELE